MFYCFFYSLYLLLLALYVCYLLFNKHSIPYSLNVNVKNRSTASEFFGGIGIKGLYHFLSARVVNAWNSLPRDTNFNSVAGLKRSIAKVDFTAFLKGDFMLS